MNYHKVYEQLIVKALLRKTVAGYKERHHIVPKSMGGTDHASNLVELTAREHFIAHNCLARMHGGRQWYAVVLMAKQCQISNSRLYEVAKIKRSEEHRKGGWTHSESERLAKSKRQKNVIHSPEWNESVSLSKKGKPLSEKNKLALRGPRGPWSEARRGVQEMKYLNKLIDSVFQPEAVKVSA
jgi:hypothetical protein